MEAKEPVYSRSLSKRLKIQFPVPFEAGRKAGMKESEDKLVLLRAEADGYLSQLLDVQKDCIKARKAGIREVFESSLQFIVAHRETLCDVGEWAECQDVGRFLYISNDQLKEWGTGTK